MTINKTVENGKAIIAPEGHIDTLTAPELEGVIKEILPGTKELILDFEKIGYISSAGLRVLLSAQKAMNEQGEMKLCHVNDAVNDIFEVTGFSDILTIE
ncbi:MAG: STAS domain-containing protein [Clostridia bacterium]|nr:STAS domain-containing protein [Clostridia bacterium]